LSDYEEAAAARRKAAMRDSTRAAAPVLKG
jgi:hypothetical protein